jgi:hypothetical protein
MCSTTLLTPRLRVGIRHLGGCSHRHDQPVIAFCLLKDGRTTLPASAIRCSIRSRRWADSYCSRHEAAGPCPYVNICGTCDNYVTGPEFADTIHDQLTDVQHLQADAETRGRDGDAARHARVAQALTGHLQRLGR